MKKITLMFFNFFKLFLIHLKRNGQLLDSNHLKSHLRENFKVSVFIMFSLVGVVSGMLLAYFEAKIHDKAIVFSVMLKSTFDPLMWLILVLVAIFFLAPFSLTNEKTQNIGEFIGLYVERAIKTINLAKWIYLAAFVLFVFDSYFISFFIFESAKCYGVLFLLLFEVSSIVFVLFFEVIMVGIFVLSIITFISDLISQASIRKSLKDETT